MNTLEVTWWRATKVWWSLIWRGILYGLLITFPVGFLVGMISAALGITDQIKPYANLAGAIISIPIAIWVVKIVLNKQFSDFQIVLVPSYESMLDEQLK